MDFLITDIFSTNSPLPSHVGHTFPSLPFPDPWQSWQGLACDFIARVMTKCCAKPIPGIQRGNTPNCATRFQIVLEDRRLVNGAPFRKALECKGERIRNDA